MNANDIKSVLSEEDIINLLMALGSDSPQVVKDGLAFRTICHGGDSHKLIYYTETKTFNCYTHCGFIGSIFDVVSRILDLDFITSFNYVCNFFNINFREIRDVSDLKTDTSFIKKFSKKEEVINLKTHDVNVLNNFDKLYHQSWLDNYISIETMRLFDIRFDILNYRIIIPHFDINSKLIGIRSRNLKEEEVERGRKYTPITLKNILYNYPTHLNLFGIHLHKEAIKRHRKVIIVESEKAVMQLHSYYKDECIAVAVSGSVIHSFQIKLLKSLGVETVILAVDKDFNEVGDAEELLYRTKVKKSFVEKLNPYFGVELIWDFSNLLNYKDAPTDLGFETWLKLYQERLFI